MLKLRYYQQEGVNSFFEYTAENHGKHPLIVMPTGSGKSLIIANIIKEMLHYENTRVLCITHQKELIKQNHAEFIENFDHSMFLDVGIYSAGLNCRDTQNRIIFAGIQSVYKKAYELGWFDVILCDECHLIPHSGEGMYRTFFSDMEKINPKVVIGGLSATPYRMKEGILTEGQGALFDDICYEVSVKELIQAHNYKNKDKTQFLCNLISKSGESKADLSKVHIRGGEYIPKEMEEAFMKGDLVCRSIVEMQKYTQDRNKVLIFTAGIEHCEEVSKKMDELNLESRYIHSQQSSEINDKNIKDFKDGKFKYLVNVNVLTTGFNEKAIDCIVLLRSTKSPGLYSQMVGRGLRLHPSKENCLILDFGRNIELHGPIDKIEIKTNKNGEREVGTAPQKECPNCHSLIHLSVMECPDCGHIFPQKDKQKDKHDEKASNADILSKWKKPQEYEVLNTSYSRHQKTGKPDSVRVSYYYDAYNSFNEYICLDHGGFASKKAKQWIKNRTNKDIYNVDELLEEISNFPKPVKIVVDENDKFPKIKGYYFEEKKQEEEKRPKFLDKETESSKDFDKKIMELM